MSRPQAASFEVQHVGNCLGLLKILLPGSTLLLPVPIAGSGRQQAVQASLQAFPRTRISFVRNLDSFQVNTDGKSAVARVSIC